MRTAKHPLDRWEVELRGDYQPIPYQPTMSWKPWVVGLAIVGLGIWGWIS